MKTPNLNRRISIQSQSTSQDAFGQPSQTWTTQYTCWAEIDVQQSQLIWSTAEFVAKTTHRITIRWTKSVVFEPNMRIVYTEPATNVITVFNIEGILNPKQANHWLIFLCYAINESE